MPGEGQGLCALAEQRSQRAPGRLNRVCSAVTRVVNLLVGKILNAYSALQAADSGQLRFLGSCPPLALEAVKICMVKNGRRQPVPRRSNGGKMVLRGRTAG